MDPYINSTAILWTKSTCPFCIMAKNILKQKNIPFIEHDLTIGSPEQINIKKQNMLKLVPNAKTVPQIFLNGKYIGGYTDLKDYFDKIDSQSKKLSNLMNILFFKNVKKYQKSPKKQIQKIKSRKSKPIKNLTSPKKYKEKDTIVLEDIFFKPHDNYIERIYSPSYRKGTLSYISRNENDQEKYDERQLYLKASHELDKVGDNVDGSPDDEVDYGDPHGI